jgi:hypothetical protein
VRNGLGGVQVSRYNNTPEEEDFWGTLVLFCITVTVLVVLMSVIQEVINRL